MRLAQHTIGIRPGERSQSKTCTTHTYADQFYLLLLCVIEHFTIRLFLLHRLDNAAPETRCFLNPTFEEGLAFLLGLNAFE